MSWLNGTRLSDGRLTSLDARFTCDISEDRRHANTCRYLIADLDLSGNAIEADGYLMGRKVAGLD
ncbi:MAG: hypothetical protein ACRCYU_15775 [Nocardioides sp.]